MKAPRFTVYQDKAGAWRWRLQAANNRVLATGEAHTRKADAERAARTVLQAVVAMKFPLTRLVPNTRKVMA